MRESYERHFAKWEAKKREQLGDAEFLKKYIRVYEISDKHLKFIHILLACASTFIVAWRILELCLCFTTDNVLFVFISVPLAATWIIFTFVYYLFTSYGMHGRHVERWKAEQKKLSND